jgi:uncharacterized protein YcbX
LTITVTDLYRYPVKGLSAEPQERCELTPGEGLPHDRRFALAHGSTDFDPQAPRWLPKTNFLMLMRDEKLAQLRVVFEETSGELTILRDGKQVCRAKASEPVGRALIAQFFAGFMAGAARGAPKLVEAPGHMFSDSRAKSLSIINLASVADLERVVRQEVHPLRFRANVYVDGLEPWEEFRWAGREVTLGGARLEITKPIDRCAATNVNPVTAARDLNIPLSLQRGFGHVHMGVYGVVTQAGGVAVGDRLMPPELTPPS